MAAESTQMIRMADILDRNSQREFDVEAFPGSSISHGADSAPLYRMQSAQMNDGYGNPPPRYSPQVPRRVHGNHPFRHSWNPHHEENTPAQPVPDPPLTSAPDNNVTRRRELVELKPGTVHPAQRVALLTLMVNIFIFIVCLAIIIAPSSWDKQGNYDKHSRRARWAAQVSLIQLGYLIYNAVLGSVPPVRAGDDAETYKERLVIGMSNSMLFGAFFWLVWGTIVFAAV